MPVAEAARGLPSNVLSQMNAPELRLSRIKEGLPFPRGATWDGQGVNFALFSAHATKVELCLFDHGGKTRDRAHRASRVSRRDLARLPARSRPARSTATACTAPTSRTRATASTRTSWCSTPTRERSSAALDLDPALLRLQDGRAADDLTFDERDSAPFMPKCVVVDARLRLGDQEVGGRCRGTHHLLRDARQGFTKLHPAVPEDLRGTFDGLRPKAIIDYSSARHHLGRTAAGSRLRRR